MGKRGGGGGGGGGRAAGWAAGFVCLAVADSIKIIILCMLEVCIEAIIWYSF